MVGEKAKRAGKLRLILYHIDQSACFASCLLTIFASYAAHEYTAFVIFVFYSLG